jgi:serine/threonine protein kinase
MELIPQGYRNLGLPPSLVTCTRDTFAEGTEFSPEQITFIAHQMADILAHLHEHKVSHGDAYAHNTMINDESLVLFGDFGAATDLSSLPAIQREAMELIEVRALGCLIDDVLSQVSSETRLTERLRAISEDCLQADFSLRPTLKELVERLASLQELLTVDVL